MTSPALEAFVSQAMDDFNIYDVGAGTRQRIAVAHNES
jgi:hypothetical protein